MKQKLNTADVAGEVSCLRAKLTGWRLSNVYDINARTYLLKFAKSGDDAEKVFVLVESGARMHTTDVLPDKNNTPSNFCLKLRKHLRTRRLEDIRQLGVDRIVDLQFGKGDNCHHLLLEFFAQGNVILTDAKYEVLTLLRSHRDDAKGLAIMARHPYPIHSIRYYQPISMVKLQQAAADGQEHNRIWKDVLQTLLPYGPAVCEHCILEAGLQPSAQPPACESELQDAVRKLLDAVHMWDKWLAAAETVPVGGYILTKQAKDGTPLYDGFEPLRLHQKREVPCLEFSLFDDALKEYYGKAATQKQEAARSQQEQAATSKLDKLKQDQEKRVRQLWEDAQSAEHKAQLLETHHVAVDAAIQAVREALATGMSWRDLGRMIKDERKAGNPIAALIDSLHLERNVVTLLLSSYEGEDSDEEWDEEANTMPATKIDVDITLDAFKNATLLYEVRRKHITKHQKTLDAAEKVVKAAEKKAAQQLQQVRTTAAVAAVRKPFWFEKFHWFVSSENYVVLSGRDAQQNELLVKRYLRRGDVYVHADLHGASSTIIKNRDPDFPIPPLTLSQAGAACVCRSAAWDAKVVTSAWWVHHNQVSKTAPTGEYLTVGSFMIRGKKNYLPPQPLVMGLAFLFRVDESCIAWHIGERAVRGHDEGDGAKPAGLDELEEGLDGGDDAQSAVNGVAPNQSALDAFLDGGLDPLAGPAATAKKQAAGQDRYGLSQNLSHRPSTVGHEADFEGSRPGAQGLEGPSKQRVPAHERRQQKKGSAKENGQHHGKANGQTERGQQEQQQAMGKPAGNAVQQQQHVRGKSSKSKKIRDRYADQDDEDRQLALQLLQPQGERKDKATRRAERKAKKEAKRAQQHQAVPSQAATQEDILRVRGSISTLLQQQQGQEGDANRDSHGEQEAYTTSPSSDSDDGDEECQPPIAPASAQAASAATAAEQLQHLSVEGTESLEGAQQLDGDVPHTDQCMDAVGNSAVDSDNGDDVAAGLTAEEEAAEAAADAAEVAALLAEENVELLPQEELARLSEVDCITGLPRADDILLHALPMCAPYSVLAAYKHKVKLLPGTQRKGKAAKQAIELLLRQPEVAPRERELIKAVPDMDNIQVMIGNCKVAMPGLSKLQTKQRQGKKAGKK